MPGLWIAVGCAAWHDKPYGEEQQLFLPGEHRQVWAIAPAINISGESQIDPLLQSDLVYQEMQKIHGLTVIPVDRVVEVYASLKIDKIQNERQAYDICKALGLRRAGGPDGDGVRPVRPAEIRSVTAVVREARDVSAAAEARPARTGTQRRRQRRCRRCRRRTTWPRWLKFTTRRTERCAIGFRRIRQGRTDPNGPLGVNEITQSMDRYCAFGYHELLNELLGESDREQTPDENSPMAKSTSDNTSSPETDTMKTLSLVKGRHHFCFRYEAGQEAGVLEFPRGIGPSPRRSASTGSTPRSSLISLASIWQKN